jgi:diacylglycerol O-acyltransferase / wax synthase
VDRLTPDDRTMLWPDALWPQDIGALILLDGGGLFDPDGRFRIEAVQQAVESRLHLLPRFRRVLHVPRWGLGGPLWVDACSFDIRDHVGEIAVPAPADEQQLLTAVEHLRARRLDRSRPLWELWFLTGLPDARVGLFARFHHVIADGVAGVASLAAFLDATPNVTAGPVPAWQPAPSPTSTALLTDALRRRTSEVRRAGSVLAHPVVTLGQARSAWPAVRELVDEGPATATSMNRVIGPGRALTLIRADLQQIKAIGHAGGATVNDVLLTLIAAGLRGLLASRGEPVEGVTVRAYVPVSLRLGAQGPTTGNRITQMVVPLPLGGTDPRSRLHQIAAETTIRKTRRRPPLGSLFRNRILSLGMLALIKRRPVNVTTADIPGPQQPLYFAGARVLEVFPLMNLIGNVSIGVAALSYDGRLGIMVVADRDTYPDLAVFTATAAEELHALDRTVVRVTAATAGA